MLRSKRLQVVVEMAEQVETTAAQAYELAVKALQSEERKLLELREYYQEYQQYGTESGIRIRAEQIARQRAFLLQLGAAIEQQSQLITMNERAVNLRRSEWHKTHLRHKATKDLVTRIKDQEGSELEKLAVKELDEWVTQSMAYK